MNQLLQERYSVNRVGAGEPIRAARNFTTETLIQPELERRRAVSRHTPPVLEFNVTRGRVSVYRTSSDIPPEIWRRAPRNRTSALQLGLNERFRGEVAVRPDQLGSARAVHRIPFLIR